ncbi:MAG: cupin domain-containing protein, partial [Gammaproteobacteria bacterium]
MKEAVVMKRVAQFLPLLLTAAFVAGILFSQVTVTEAQHKGAKITGKVTDKLIHHFDASGLPGVLSIDYRRLDMAPGSKMEGKMFMDDHVEFCIVEKGAVTITTADGTKRSYKQGDAFIKPKGLKQTVMEADPQQGFVELYWIINLKGRH